MNLIFAIAGSIIGLMLIRKRIGVKRALLIDFLLILLGLLIQLNFV